jgi:glycine cleavage system aminomethyltransferase T
MTAAFLMGKLGVSAGFVRFNLRMAPGATRVLLGQLQLIGKRQAGPEAAALRNVTPMQIKRTLDDALIEAGTPYGIVPAGVWALDIARIEAGLIMLDVDYFSAHHALIEARKSSPFEINLGWAVSAAKGPFNGRRALAAEKARGAAWGSSASSPVALLRAALRGPRLRRAAHRLAASAPVCGKARRSAARHAAAGRRSSSSWPSAHLERPLRSGFGGEMKYGQHRRMRAAAVAARSFFEPAKRRERRRYDARGRDTTAWWLPGPGG